MSRHRAVVLVRPLVVLAVVAGLLTPPATAAEAPATPDATRSVWDGPWSPTIDAAQVDRFVALWAPRIADAAWLDSFLQLDEIPADIAAEGYHRLDRHTQIYLTQRLFQHLAATNPGILADTIRLPKTEIDQEKLVLFSFVFDHAMLKAFRDKMEAQTPQGASSEPAAGPTELDKRIEALNNIPALQTAAPPYTKQAPAPGSVVVNDIAKLPPTDAFTAVAKPGAAVAVPAAPIWSGEQAASATKKLAQQADATSDVRLSEVVPPAAVSLDLPDNRSSQGHQTPSVIGFTVYAVCVESASVNGCSNDTPLGAPALVDVTGDGAPDVTAQLTPGLNPSFPGGVALGIQVTKLVPGADLPAHVYVVWDTPASAARLSVGFDGRPSSLADSSSLTATVKSVPAAAAGNVGVNVRINNSNAQSPAALTFGVEKLTAPSPVQPAVASDPIRGSLLFQQVPASFGVDLDMNRLAGSAEDYKIQVTSSVATVLEPSLTIDNGSARREITGVVDKLPTDVTLRFSRGAAGEINADYLASSVIDRVAFEMKTTPDRSAPGTHQLLSGEVLALPSELHVAYTPPAAFTYRASSSIPKVTVGMQDVASSAVVRSLSAVAESVPTQIALSVGANPAPGPAGQRIAYTANAVLGKLTLGLDKPDDMTTASAVIQGIPSSCTLLLAGSSMDATCSAPITLIDATLSTKSAPVVDLPGDFGSLKRAADGGLGARLRLSGLQAARIEQRTSGAFASFSFPGRGAQPFRAYYQDPSILADATISNLPSTISVDVQPSAITYEASEVISQISAHAEMPGTTLDAILQGIPSNVSVAWTTGASPTFTYSASAALTRIFASIRAGTTAVDADVQSLPKFMQVAVSPDVVSFDGRTAPGDAAGSGAIGSLLLKYASNGVYLTGLPADDHVALKQGAATQAELKFTGLKLASVDTRNDEIHAQLLSTGPRILRASADTPTALVSGVINKLPADVRVDYVGTSIDYRASSVIDEVLFSIDKRNGETLSAQVLGIPATVDIDWTTGTSPSATWSASSSMTGINLSHRQGPGAAALDASLAGLPPYARVEFGGEQATFDARTSPTAASGSAALGSISVAYASNGVFLGPPSGDHVVFSQAASPAVTKATLRLTGLKLVTYDARSDQLHARVLATSPRVLLVAADTPVSLTVGMIDQLPTDVRVDLAGNTVTYQASSTIGRAWAYLDKKDGQTVYGDVTGVPASATITVDNAAQRVNWAASSPVTRVIFSGRALVSGRTWDAFFDAQTVPASWELVFASAHPVFRGISGPIGRVSMYATNHGSATTFPGNFASIVYRSATGDVDVGFGMNAINLADLQQTSSGFTSDLRMGGGGAFRAYVDIVNGFLGAKLDATVNPLPTSIQISQAGEEIRYASNANFDLSTYFEAGDTRGITAAPAPPSLINTLSFRDGRGSGCSPCLGFKGRFNLLGFPTGFVSSPSTRTVTITNFRPPAAANFLGLDVDVDDVVTPRTRVIATQSGIPSPVSFTFGPFTTETLGSGAKRTSFAYSSTGTLGSLNVYLERGTDVGDLFISNIPSSVNGNVTTANGTSTVSLTHSLSPNLGQVRARFRRTSDISFLASVQLFEVPTSMSLSFGRVTFDPAGSDEFTAPGLSYSANSSTLDILGSVGASLFGGDVQAAATLNVTNLGASTTLGLDGSTLKVRSTPATSNLEVHTWGRIRYLRSFGGCLPSSCPTLRIQYSGHAGVVPITINDLMVRAQSVSSLDVKLGITSKVTGSYGSFSFGFQSIAVSVDFYAQLEGCFAGGCATFASTPEIHTTFNLTINWVGATNHEYKWIDYDTPFVGINICSFTADWNIVVYMRPHQHFYSGSPSNGFTISSATAEGGAWFLTPNPNGFFSSGVMEVAQALTADGGGLRFELECH